MRPQFLLVALQSLLILPVNSQHAVINEVLAANVHGPVDGYGEHEDAVELYNPSTSSFALDGVQFVMNRRTWTVRGDVSVPGEGHLVLWFDGETGQGADHAPLKLPRNGGTLMMIAANGTQVLDVFHYPELEQDVSFGRYPDGADRPGYFTTPTLGGPVVPGAVLDPPPASPMLRMENDRLQMIADPDARILYAIGGPDPLGDEGQEYITPVHVEDGTVIKAVAVRKNSMPSKARLWRYRLEMKAPKFPIASLVIDPQELWSDRTGINVSGTATNYSRSGEAWQREAHFGWTTDSTIYSKVGVAIAGSGTRSLPKRSFKLRARARFGSDGNGIQAPSAPIPAHEAVLRADATSGAFLHNLFMEQVALQAGSNVDVGPSTVVAMELNGEYWGQYRLTPPKDPKWIMRQHDVQAIDMLAGPSLRVIEGDRQAFHEPLGLLSSLISVDDLQQELNSTVDVRSLFDLAALDLYSGRADHDINVRCWRPKVQGGRWRWILYDMDLWAPVEERTLQRMASTAYYEAPFLRTIVEDQQLSIAFLGRFGAMLNTVLSEDRAGSLLDQLYTDYRESMQRDHLRWKDEMYVPSAEEQFNKASTFVGSRASDMFQQVSDHFRLDIASMEVQLSEENAGTILIDGLPLTKYRATVTGWESVAFQLEAVPAEGMEFVGWKGMEDEGPMVLIDPSKHRMVKAIFRKRSGSNGL